MTEGVRYLMSQIMQGVDLIGYHIRLEIPVVKAAGVISNKANVIPGYSS